MSQRSVRRTTKVSYVSRAEGGLGAAEQRSIVVPSPVSVASPDSSTGSSINHSPTFNSRVQEKNLLQQLNDRLATYIDRVRTLETENKRLNVIIRESDERISREQTGIREMYERQLADARRKYDVVCHDRNQLQTESQKHHSVTDELKRTNVDTARQLASAQYQLKELTTRIRECEDRKQAAEAEHGSLLSKVSDLQNQNKGLQEKLESEMVKSLDLENQLKSLRDELAFMRQLHDKDTEETRRKRELEISTINQEYKDEFNQKLQEALTAMREQMGENIKSNRREIEDLYENKLKTLRDMAEESRRRLTTVLEDSKISISNVTALEEQCNELNDKLVSKEKAYNDAMTQLRQLREEMYSRLGLKDEEIRQAKAENEEMMKEYKDLRDMKLMLTMEIETYRRLLEGEEARLQLSPPPPCELSDTESTLGTKRRRIYQEREYETFSTYKTKSNSISAIRISDHDLDGGFVKVINTGKQDTAIGSWLLKRQAGGVEVIYKFNTKMVIRPNMIVTVWSCDSGVQPHPPAELVMKQQQWPVGPRIRTSLIDDKNLEVAWRESEKESMSQRTTFRSDPNDAVSQVDLEKRCSVM